MMKLGCDGGWYGVIKLLHLFMKRENDALCVSLSVCGFLVQNCDDDDDETHL